MTIVKLHFYPDVIKFKGLGGDMKKLPHFIAGFAFLPLLWIACGPKEKVTRVAVALPLTGDIAALGQGLNRASALALEEQNAQGRFAGFKVEMVSFDDRSDPREAVSVANRIVSDPSIVAVVGHFN